MAYLKGKDLRYKGHTLDCYYNDMPTPIIYKTDNIECIEAFGEVDDIIVRIKKRQKPEGFEKW